MVGLDPMVAGLIASLLAQLTKADGWNRWAKALYGLVVAGGAGYLNSPANQDGIILTVAVALASHSLLLNGTTIGEATKWNLLGKVGDVVRSVFPSQPQP